MSNRNPHDQISKASWTLMEGIKDAVNTNVATASRTVLKIEPQVLVKLLAIINASVEEGFHKGSKTFSRAVAGVIEKVEEDVMLLATKS